MSLGTREGVAINSSTLPYLSETAGVGARTGAVCRRCAREKCSYWNRSSTPLASDLVHVNARKKRIVSTVLL